jgi:hypothetical protein
VLRACARAPERGGAPRRRCTSGNLRTRARPAASCGRTHARTRARAHAHTCMLWSRSHLFHSHAIHSPIISGSDASKWPSLTSWSMPAAQRAAHTRQSRRAPSRVQHAPCSSSENVIVPLLSLSHELNTYATGQRDSAAPELALAGPRRAREGAVSVAMYSIVFDRSGVTRSGTGSRRHECARTDRAYAGRLPPDSTTQVPRLP